MIEKAVTVMGYPSKPNKYRFNSNRNSKSGNTSSKSQAG